jgi:NitT/TauT family transport system substrate-binding protein
MTLLMSCKSQPHGAILQREWTANAEFAGDLWASKLSEKHGFKLEVREGSEVIDPIKMVRSGSAQFGVASSDRVLREIDGGADLVVLATASYRSPVVFLSHPALHIKAPADFKGRRIGIQAGTNTDLIFKALIRTVPLSINDMRVVESGFGTTNFETGTLDVLAAFDYDEPVQLEIKKIPFDVIEPEKFGVHFIGTVYFTSKSLVEKNPKLVQAFLDSLIEGWTKALAHPDEAIDLLASRFPSVDKKKEVRSLQRGRPYFAGEDGRLLYASPSRWAQMGDQLVSMGVLKRFAFDNSVDYQFLNTALKGPQR